MGNHPGTLPNQWAPNHSFWWKLKGRAARWEATRQPPNHQAPSHQLADKLIKDTGATGATLTELQGRAAAVELLNNMDDVFPIELDLLAPDA